MSRPTLATIAVAAFFMCVVLPRATLPMADGDAWWHIHAGEEIVATGRVPDTNTWTIAGAGFEWTSQDWLSNVVMAALFNTGPWGIALLSLAFALSVVAAFALLWSAIGVRPGSSGWLGRICLLTAGLIVAGPIIGIRVQTLDLLMASATVWTLWSWRSAPKGRQAALLPVIALIWVNLHAGWVMLFLLGGATLVGETIDGWLGRRSGGPVVERHNLVGLAIALGAAAVALVLNPNGPAIYVYPFETAAIGAHRDFLVEWSPPNLASFEGQVTVAFAMGIVLPTFVAAGRRMPTADLLWLVGITVMAVSAVRFALFLGPIGAALVAVHLPAVVRRARLKPAADAVLRRFSRPPSSPSLALVNLALAFVVVIAGAGVSVIRAVPAAQTPYIERSIPIQAAQWVADHRPNARIFNTYSWGGYLTRELPEARVYIDGRSDIYGNEVLQEYARTLNASVDPHHLLDAAAIDTVLVKVDAPIARALAEAPHWRAAYRDTMAVVLIRDRG